MNPTDYTIEINGQHEFEISEEQLEGSDIIYYGNGRYHMILENHSFEFFIQSVDLDSKKIEVRSRGKIFSVVIKDHLDKLIETLGLEIETAGADANIYAPMPGLVLEVIAEVGQVVQEGDQLLILEAMKMENVIKAGGKGTVESIQVKKGDGVEKGQLMLTFRPNND